MLNFNAIFLYVLINIIFSGVPLLARDQSAVLSAAHRNLALQGGRPMATLEDELGEIPLSTEAKNCRDLLMNMYDNSLPDNLPSFELLATLSLSDCREVISSKLEKSKDSTDTVDVDAFQKATCLVHYNLPQVDNRLDQLHSATFLRAPLSEPEVWSHLMPKKLPQVISELCYSSIVYIWVDFF